MAAARALTLSPATRRLGAVLTLPNPHSQHSKCLRIVGRASYSSEDGTSVVGGKEEYVNDAAKELGVTRYYCNRNPRSLELLGMAEKPKGFETARRRVDYYHR